MEKATEYSKGIQKVMNHLDQFEENLNFQLNRLILVVAICTILLSIQIMIMF